MRINITYQEAMNLEYHTLKKFMDSMVEIMESIGKK